MLALVTDRVQATTMLEDGVHVVAPFEDLGDADETVRQYDALVVAVSADVWHNARFQRWITSDVRPHMSDLAETYPTMVPSPPPERADLDVGRCAFKHVPDGAAFMDGAESYFKVRAATLDSGNAVVYDPGVGGCWAGDIADFEGDRVVVFDHNEPTLDRLTELEDDS